METETTASRVRRVTWLPIVHLICCIALSVCIVVLLDGYLAVSETSPRTTGWGEYRLRVSDITTLIQVALTIIKLLVGAWVGTVVWNCVFILLASEHQGLTLAQINRLSSFYVPPFPKGPAAYQVFLLLLLIIPQLLIAPLLTGAIGWSEANEAIPSLTQVQSGNPYVDPNAWYYYQVTLKNRRGSVERAAAYASMTWPDLSQDHRHCRHIMNPDSVPINSTVFNATIPCIQIHSITFPDSPPPTEVFNIAREARSDGRDQLSCIDDPPLSYFNDGNSVLFDPANLHPPYPEEDVGQDIPLPGDFLQTGTLDAITLIIGPEIDSTRNSCSNITGNIFGVPSSPNIFSFQRAEGPYYRCYSHAVVNLTAGVATSPQSTYLSAQVVEATLPDVEMDIRPGPWVQEAIYLLPDTMSMVRRMDTAALASWHDLPGYLDRLIRYSYMANWDMLSRSFDTDVTTLQVQSYEPRLRASVSKERTFAWLGISVLLTVSAIFLLLRDLVGQLGQRGVITDGVLAALLTDPNEVLNDYGRQELTKFSHLASDHERIGSLSLRERDEEGCKLVKSEQM